MQRDSAPLRGLSKAVEQGGENVSIIVARLDLFSNNTCKLFGGRTLLAGQFTL